MRRRRQWFIGMSETGLRDEVLKAIGEVDWDPKAGRNRIHAMVENRADWVISRQRAWGVPLTIFAAKADGAILRDPQVNQRIFDAIAEKGADAWFDTDPQVFLGDT